MVEFTGERVVPGQVSDDLWSEHLARYAFALQFAGGRRVLDCGCGTGYGAAELASAAAAVTALDLSADAVAYAREMYSRPNTTYVAGSCLDLAFPARAFDLVVAFEVIEHLTDFHRLLEECRRVLSPGGLFLVSTPNKLYYAESRAESGPNPFHEHEFEAAEFRTELEQIFPNVVMLYQNRVECFAFTGAADWTGRHVPIARIDNDSGTAGEAHFFIAICSAAPLPAISPFVYVPRAANLLRERERHIILLEDQLRRMQDQRDRLLERCREQNDEIEARNRWAENLNLELTACRTRIADVQNELATSTQAYEAKVGELDAENVAKTKWALDTEQRLGAEIQRISAQLADYVRLLDTAEQTVVERTLWAQGLEREKEALESKINAVRASRWVQLGHKVGLGPQLQ